MIRTVISLDPEDKAWLDKTAASTGQTMAELVRRAVRRLRDEEETSFREILKQTRGLWKAGDGLAYQRKIRREWR